MIKAIPVYLLVNLFSLGVCHAGKVIAWGDEPEIVELPGNIISVSAGYMHSLALSESGEVFAWGSNSDGQLDLPASVAHQVVSIAAGGMHNLALLGNGSIVAWGSNEDGQITVPKAARGVIGISAGLFHSLALKKDGTVLAWGYNEFGQCWIPTGLDDVEAIAAGALHSLALDDDGEVVAWGDNAFGQIFVPEEAEDDIIAIAAGYFHNLALTEDGEVIAWGDNASGQCNVPEAARHGVVAIAAGQNISLAIKADGTLISWGGGPSPRGSSNKRMPAVSQIASGGSHNLAIVPDHADSNQDGIPDWWEVAHGLNRTSYDARSTDSDSDGQFDAEEFIADTNPLDAASVFGLALSFDGQATGNILYGPVSTDRIYTLEYTTNLAGNEWETVETFHNVPGLQAASVAAIPMAMIPEAGNRIYRVRVALP